MSPFYLFMLILFTKIHFHTIFNENRLRMIKENEQNDDERHKKKRFHIKRKVAIKIILKIRDTVR